MTKFRTHKDRKELLKDLKAIKTYITNYKETINKPFHLTKINEWINEQEQQLKLNK